VVTLPGASSHAPIGFRAASTAYVLTPKVKKLYLYYDIARLVAVSILSLLLGRVLSLVVLAIGSEVSDVNVCNFSGWS